MLLPGPSLPLGGWGGGRLLLPGALLPLGGWGGNRLLLPGALLPAGGAAFGVDGAFALVLEEGRKQCAIL